jgi:DNA-binding MarR family transcriptional regulator
MTKIDKFSLLAKSLTLYNRHSLDDIVEGTNLTVEDLYIDPLQSGGIQSLVLQSRFLMLLGRKGTGKSILFDLCQKNLNTTKDSVGVYVNCFNVYLEHTYDVTAQMEVISAGLSGFLSEDQILRYLYRRGLVQGILADLIEQIRVKASNTWADSLKEKLGITKYHEIVGQLSALADRVKTPTAQEVALVKTALVKTQDESSNKQTLKTGGKIGIEISAKDGIKPSAGLEQSEEITDGNKTTSFKEYSTVLLQVFKPREIFREIFGILAKVGIKKVHLFVDDFSELGEEFQGILSNSLLSQLHQWTDFAIHVVIAGYPQRTYLGSEVDSSKVDIIRLDFDDVYKHLDLPDKHAAAVEFIRRLIQTRLTKICQEPFETYFEDNVDEALKTLFQASYNSPRMIGKILQICERTQLRAGSKISPNSIKDAAKEYYETRRNYFEKTDQYSIRESDLPFRSPLEAVSQMELLDKISEKQKLNQTHIATTKYRDMGKTPPVSHFHITKEYEQYVDFLQVNYFINKVAEMSVKTDKDVASIYALNLGLCASNRIQYWEPSTRDYRDYLKERFFHFDDLLNNFLSTTKKIVCNRCSYVFPFKDHDAFVKFKWNCPECAGLRTCQVAEELIDKSKELQNIAQNRLPEIELKMLGAIKELENNATPAFPKDIAGEIDCTYQLVSKRMDKLKNAPFTLVLSDKEKDSVTGQQRTVYKLTAKAKGTYF